jgi:multicomponent Na+:H+ antiporter subunit B
VAFLAAAVAVAVIFLWGVYGLPSFGHYPGPYGDEVVRSALHDRHATNAVTSVVMDIRAVDTAGEELILFAAAVGVIMLLRKQRGERLVAPPAFAEGRHPIPPSNPVRVVSAALIAPAVILGLYLVGHGQLTPGGGFQGGVVLAVPSVLVFLAARIRSFERLHPGPTWEIAQAIAIAAFLGVGVVGLIDEDAFLANVLPFGTTGTVYSAGTIPVLNVIAGPAVATAIVLILIELLEQVTEVRGRGARAR